MDDFKLAPALHEQLAREGYEGFHLGYAKKPANRPWTQLSPVEQLGWMTAAERVVRALTKAVKPPSESNGDDAEFVPMGAPKDQFSPRVGSAAGDRWAR